MHGFRIQPVSDVCCVPKFRTPRLVGTRYRVALAYGSGSISTCTMTVEFGPFHLRGPLDPRRLAYFSPLDGARSLHSAFWGAAAHVRATHAQRTSLCCTFLLPGKTFRHSLFVGVRSFTFYRVYEWIHLPFTVVTPPFTLVCV